MKIYIAAPLFNEMELERNLKVAMMLEANGYETYLPQRDGGCVSDIIKKTNRDPLEVENEIFRMDIQALKMCDELLILLDGVVLDDGSCFELGYMYCEGKPCNGYKTDVRASYDEKLNLMIDKSLNHLFSTFQELELYYTNKVKGMEI